MSRIISITRTWCCIAGPISAKAAFRPATARAWTAGVFPARQQVDKRRQCRRTIRRDAHRRRPARKLLRIDIDPDQVAWRGEAAIGVHIIVRRSKFGSCRDDQICFRHHAAYRLQARAGVNRERMAVEKTAPIGRRDDRGVEQFGKLTQRAFRAPGAAARQNERKVCSSGKPRGLGDRLAIGCGRRDWLRRDGNLACRHRHDVDRYFNMHGPRPARSQA